MSTGYALQNQDYSIDIKTVSESKRAVMVNSLAAQAGIFVDKSWTDERIERNFGAYVRGIIVPVEVNVKEPQR